jgi:hypothetical protein
MKAPRKKRKRKPVSLHKQRKLMKQRLRENEEREREQFIATHQEELEALMKLPLEQLSELLRNGSCNAILGRHAVRLKSTQALRHLTREELLQCLSDVNCPYPKSLVQDELSRQKQDRKAAGKKKQYPRLAVGRAPTPSAPLSHHAPVSGDDVKVDEWREHGA